MKTDIPKTIRCAIYTRKSTDEGLEQEFNSLHAQREAAEAYITSQKSQGWTCLPDQYDDGGFTGGNMDRPALGRMLADIDAGLIDCVVVYKVDRLSRSLMDFAKILERFESKGVSFVSVTQQFNTTTSMGRLTLNILLSFAQFEREVISERTRDKIAMARKRGKYTGGRPVLGYDISAEVGKLVINEIEAERVRTIFDMYLRLGSVLPVVEELRRFGWHTKEWVTRKGTVHKGHPYDKNRVHALLKNPIYTGKMQYDGVLYEGEHEAIITEEIFKQAQRQLAANRNVPTCAKPNKHGGILKGIIRCKTCGCGMSHSYSKKADGRRYRYYICNNATKTGWKNCPHPSLPAAEMTNETTFAGAGWDFDKSDGTADWFMNGYPQLTWQPPAEKVDFDELLTLTEYWLFTGCTSDQPCTSADWYTDGKINLLDFRQLALSWMGEDMIFQPRSVMTDDFETGDFTALDWDDYYTDWIIDDSTVFEGNFSARSKVITNNQRSDMYVEVDTTGFDRISFVCKVSSELEDDYLYFYIDGVVQQRWSGESNWQLQTFEVTEGVHSFMWTFADDASTIGGANAAWVDNIRLFKAE
ncbi:DNA-invertase hin [Sedimentisphaera cyanobacteriorum]|uniref:DNA-invertase hin n=1 Tax=Sedimentisphaera cyanobacteriorum TaxID=1940790 RepID=A0A1Q2HR10_9BACT|nr:recombinase family protein [Sedimentisphaera cyanobacteriorum]AQQ09830.1 DNA-invertase hin [Sedimentisphaera cyanobacteriorum]